MQSSIGSEFKFRFVVVGKYRARTKGNDPHVTLNVLAGPDDRVVYCGTLTMSEREWGELSKHLARALGDGFEMEDRAHGHPSGPLTP